jgi:hypothetical protein
MAPATRGLAKQFELTLGVAYPARAADAFAALTGDEVLMANGLLWADVTGQAVRILDRPPRGVSLGR